MDYDFPILIFIFLFLMQRNRSPACLQPSNQVAALCVRVTH